MALMFAKGELTPMPDCAIFADTQSEPGSVYAWLTQLETLLPFPVRRVTEGCLRDDLLASVQQRRFANVQQRRFANVPFYTESKSGGGMMRRQCTREYKVEPITQELRRLIGLKPRQRAPKEIAVVQYIGISADEALRMKPSREKWIEHQWPLVDRGMTRGHCLEWMERNGYQKPSKSACTFCPYHDDRTWRDMKANDPESWADAVKVDEAIRGGVRGTKEKLYLHRSMKPLVAVDFSQPEDFGQVDAFTNECEGMCGV
jgi:hypothetical protein